MLISRGSRQQARPESVAYRGASVTRTEQDSILFTVLLQRFGFSDSEEKSARISFSTFIFFGIFKLRDQCHI